MKVYLHLNYFINVFFELLKRKSNNTGAVRGAPDQKREILLQWAVFVAVEVQELFLKIKQLHRRCTSNRVVNLNGYLDWILRNKLDVEAV